MRDRYRWPLATFWYFNYSFYCYIVLQPTLFKKYLIILLLLLFGSESDHKQSPLYRPSWKAWLLLTIFANSFFFSFSLFVRKAREKGKRRTKVVVKSHAFQFGSFGQFLILFLFFSVQENKGKIKKGKG